MATRIHSNNYITTINGDISSGATTLVATSVALLPVIGGSVSCNLTLQNGNTIEIVKATSNSGTTITIVRAQEGTTASAFASGSTLSLRPTADSIDRKLDIAGSTSTVTLGTVTTGTWHATPVELAYGGTNANLTASNGGIFYSTASAGAILAGTATAGKILQSGSSTTPAWSTPTYPSSSGSSGKFLTSDGTNNVYSTATLPATATGTGTLLRADGTNWVATTTTYPNTNAVSTLLYASSANVMSALATANSSVLVTSSGGVPSLSTALPSGLTATNLTLTTPALGTPSAGVLSSCTAYPQSALTGLGTGVSTFLATPTSANLAAALTDETGSGANVFATSPTLVTPVLGVAAATSISFGDEALSHYDEGTFTPALSFGGASTGITYSSQTGVYTRIGNTVTFSVIIILTNKGSATGTATVTGMPFSCNASLNPLYNAYFTDLTFTNYPVFLQSGTSLLIRELVSGTGASSVTNTAFANTTSLLINGVYIL